MFLNIFDRVRTRFIENRISFVGEDCKINLCETEHGIAMQHKVITPDY